MHVWAHFKTIHHHRSLVRRYCFRLGLYWQGLTHDLSKYSPVEFWAGAKYFQGDRSPNDAQRRTNGYSASWMHHKGRNRHHFEFWTDYSLDDDFSPGDPYEFFRHGKGRRLLLHPATEALLEVLLTKLRDEGEDAVFAYIRRELLGKDR